MCSHKKNHTVDWGSTSHKKAVVGQNCSQIARISPAYVVCLPMYCEDFLPAKPIKHWYTLMLIMFVGPNSRLSTSDHCRLWDLGSSRHSLCGSWWLSPGFHITIEHAHLWWFFPWNMLVFHVSTSTRYGRHVTCHRAPRLIPVDQCLDLASLVPWNTLERLEYTHRTDWTDGLLGIKPLDQLIGFHGKQ